jgi:hypothetical protein
MKYVKQLVTGLMTSNDDLLYELTWVHVSDIHTTDEPGAETQHRAIVLRQLLEDIDRRLEFGAPDPSVIVVTGDVAMTGGARRPNEYAEAASFLRSLANKVGIDVRLMIVPGNHDTQRVRPDDRTTARMLQGARAGEERLDDLLAREQDSELLNKRLALYREFVSGLSEVDRDVAEASAVTGWARTVTHGSLPVRFVGLDTALLANDDSDEGKLQLLQHWRAGLG